METSYRGLDYESGKAIQSLRNAIGLTQVGLAEHLGVSVRTVKEWEAGGSYLKVERLKALIALAVQYQAFPKGSEAEEIRALWRTTRQKRLLNEEWLSALLAGPPEQSQEALQPHVAPLAVGTGLAPVCSPQGQSQEALQPDVEPDKDRRDSALCLSDGANLLSYLPQEINLRSTPTQTETFLYTKGNRLYLEMNINLHSDEQSSRVAGSEPLSKSDLANISSANTSWHSKTIVWRKRLLISLVALAILTIIGSAGTLFFQISNGAATQSNKTQAYPGYLPGNGTLVFFDPLSQEHGSQWRSESHIAPGGACQFSKGAFHVSQPVSGYYAQCVAAGAFSNFAFEVQVTMIQGDCGGVIFREDGNGHFYVFFFCEDGGYREMKYVDYGGSDETILCTGWNPAIHRGLGQQNTIAVVASGSTMTFYANKQQIAHVQDSSYTSGFLSLIADPGLRHPTEVAYRNARLWTL